MRYHNILLLMCIFICIMSALAGKKKHGKDVASSSKSAEHWPEKKHGKNVSSSSKSVEKDVTDEQISLLTIIYKSVTSNDTNKLTITDLKYIFNKLDLVKKDEEYDVMMKLLDSDNENETGLDKFLKLFTLKSQKEKQKKINIRSVKDDTLFKFYSNGKDHIIANDLNRVESLMKKEDKSKYPTGFLEAIKKYIRNKKMHRIYYDEFCDMTSELIDKAEINDGGINVPKDIL
ncbi:uncharacterized protein LOC126897506 isoform X7 [Daktulosphaira vitifoliae]|uniref:uncharacterized protein LOC126897506 isoform X7 n=1 Tax=Daktulosphaira vitifoliae TaxID=58002 RepID=UPI0021AA7A6F|nr:uncharacterized protein LOC126897506 isoform X7 [Daktulosphaira vitifoliae]